ncbi:MAG: flagellar hook-length control protein FliK [Alphaproteobacteria bacterium]|nr:flagellar hook-length control protein FliK [Alphaproteobacteria bacterium]
MPGLPAAAATGQQVADAARTDAAASINQPKASETLINLVNQTTPKPMPGTQAVLPGIPDPLANGTLPIPLEKKLNPANFQAEIAGTGKGDDGGLKLAQQAQAQVQAQAQTKQPVTPHLRGGQAKHGGDIMPETLPRPQLHQAAAGNASGQQLSGAPQPSTNPAANAANVAGIVSSDGADAIQNLQVSVSPERTGQAELPMLTTRANGNPSPTPPAPQPLAGLPLDGEGKSNLISLGEDSGKSGGNNGTSASTASTATSSGPKAAVLVQHNATTDVRSPGIQVAMHLSKAAQNGIDRMTIRLDPAELGRVHVKLEVGHDGRTIALVAAERPETLELLQRDSRSLERALQQAGLETDSDSLSFSLSQGDQQGGALADGSPNGAENGNGGGNGQSDDGTPIDDAGVLPKVVSNRALDISV